MFFRKQSGRHLCDLQLTEGENTRSISPSAQLPGRPLDGGLGGMQPASYDLLTAGLQANFPITKKHLRRGALPIWRQVHSPNARATCKQGGA